MLTRVENTFKTIDVRNKSIDDVIKLITSKVTLPLVCANGHKTIRDMVIRKYVTLRVHARARHISKGIKKRQLFECKSTCIR